LSELYGGSLEVARTDAIIERLMKDPARAERINQIVADARLFDGLRENAGWQRLYERVLSKKSRCMQYVLDRFMGPSKNWPAVEEIAYYQGFYQGAVFVLAHPEHAEENLERAARIAYVLAYEDDKEVEA
jgi:hypothetical protein